MVQDSMTAQNAAHSVSAENQRLYELMQRKLASHVLSVSLDLGEVTVRIARETVNDFFQLLKLDSDLKFNMLLSVTALDWLDARDARFEVVYHLLSLSNLYRLRVKVDIFEEDATIDSVVPLWSSANFMEREVWDMFGIRFKGHPDLRRILMYEEFEGFPLRKDYPVQGKQPRIPLLNPEVRNTALDMRRPALVKINPREKSRQQGDAGPGDHSRFVERKYN